MASINNVALGLPGVPALAPGASLAPVTLLGGVHHAMPISHGGLYRIDADADCFIRRDTVPGVQGNDFTADTDVIGNSSTTIPAEFDWGVGNISLEFWASIRAATSNGFRISVGHATSAEVQIVLGRNAAGGGDDDIITNKSTLATDDNTAILTEANDTGIAFGETVHHWVWSITRDGADSIARLYIDGVLNSVTEWDDTANAAKNIDPSAAAGRICLGGNVPGTPAGDAILYGQVRWYKFALTQAQVVARNAAGPSTLPTDSALPFAYVDLSASGSWVSAAAPEIWDIDQAVLYTFNNVVGLDLVDWLGGTPATAQNAMRVVANRPEVIQVPGAGYLNLYSRPEDSGDVRVTPV
ncbi:MAG: hypothetical protein KDK91_33950 [Gammaproteobacteria bacterium]|nr:hypothetical protein [Gammaproteobacteria bacterium]